MTPSELAELKFQLKKSLAENKISNVFEQLSTTIPSHNLGKINTLFLLQRDFNVLTELKIKGTYGLDVLSVKQAAFLENFMHFIDSLDLEDFIIQKAAAEDKRGLKRKTGSVLYGIPSKMTLKKERKCLVRLAFDESILLEDIPEGKDIHIKAIRRIDKRMEVEILDPSEKKVFSIRSVSTPVQRVEEDDYTEWIYFIKPLQEGIYELWLKVMVIILQEGEKIKKDIVLQEKIEVVTATEETEIGVEMKRAGLIFTIGLPAAEGIAGDTESVDAISGTGTSGSAGIFASALSKIVAIAIVAGIFIGGLMYLNKGSGESFSDQQQTDSLSLEEGALPGDETAENDLNGLTKVNLKPEEYLINPNRDTILQLPTMSSLAIPANTIVGMNNQLIPGLVSVKIREIHKANELIASGISMRYFDDQKKEWWLQTAGMFDIQAYYQGRPTKIAEGKAINVNLVSSVEGPYDFWQFDRQAENWNNLGLNANTRRLSVANELLKKEIAELKRQTANPPIAPKVYKTFKYDVSTIDMSCCPELQSIDGNNVYLTYAGNRSTEALDNNDWVNKRRWRQRTLKKSSKGAGIYEFVWRGDTIFTTFVRRAPESSVKEATKARYDSLKVEYDKKLSLLKEKQEVMERQSIFQRNVQVQGFGIYNFDVLWDKPDALFLAADFNVGDMSEAALQSMEVFLITGDQRVVIKYPNGWWNKFRFSPSSDNQLLAFLPGNQVGVFTQEDFQRELSNIRKAAQSRKPYVFDLQILDGAVHSLDDLAQVIVSNASEI